MIGRNTLFSFLSRSRAGERRSAVSAGGKLAESGLEVLWEAAAAIAIVAPVFVALPFLRRVIGSTPQFDFLLASSFVVHMWTRPRWAEVAATIILAILIRQGWVSLVGGFQPYFGSSIIHWGGFLGLGSMLVSGIRAITGSRAARNTFGAVAIFPYLAVVLAFTFPFGAALNPKTFDIFLYVFDGTLGFQPSFLFGNLLLIHPLVSGVGSILYQALPVEIAIAYAWVRANPGRCAVNVLILLITASAAGFLLFCLLPACGPGHLLAESFPGAPPPISAFPLEMVAVAKAPRNCLPSLHLAGALLVWWNTRSARRWVRAAAGAYIACVVATTLAFGEHYLIDLVVAVPYSLAMQAVCTTTVPFRCSERRNAAIAGGVMTFGWIAILRFGYPCMLSGSVRCLARCSGHGRRFMPD